MIKIGDALKNNKYVSMKLRGETVYGISSLIQMGQYEYLCISSNSCSPRVANYYAPLEKQKLLNPFKTKHFLKVDSTAPIDYRNNFEYFRNAYSLKVVDNTYNKKAKIIEKIL